jgi:hypothetical protein
MIPRGPRAVARTGIGVYNPQTARARSSWELVRSLASIGGFRLLPRASAPPRPVREALAPLLPPRATYALAKANHPGRFIALVLGEQGRPIMVAKVATDDAGREALRHEVEALQSHAQRLPAPIATPRILEQADGVLLLEPVLFRRRLRPWLLPPEVAEALGVFWKATRIDSGAGPGGVAHGDFTPWNLLRTENGWTLIDWEYSWEGAPPFFDVFHFFVQAHWLLGRPRASVLLDGLRGAGPFGEAIAAYAAGADLDRSTTAWEFERYLHLTSEEYRPTARLSGGVAVRRRLLDDLRNG